jgi:hypothetical protein
MAAGWTLELPAREALAADEPTVGGVNASPAAKGASLSAVAPIVVVVVAVMARLLLLMGAGTRCSGGGRRWA